MTELVELIKDNGIGIVLMAYFLIKDWRFNTKLETYMDQLTKLTGRIEEHLDTQTRGGDADED